MADIILIATIVAFFLAAALLVRALGRVIADSGDITDRDAADDEPEVSEQGLGAGRPG